MVTVDSLAKAYEIAARFYDSKTMEHATNVAKYVAEMTSSDRYKGGSHTQGQIVIAALFHDLLEDTDYPAEEIEQQFGRDVRLMVEALTKKVDEDYDDYMKRIIQGKCMTRSILPEVYLIKKADMKDHFFRYPTLTPKLIQKYLPYVHEFM